MSRTVRLCDEHENMMQVLVDACKVTSTLPKPSDDDDEWCQYVPKIGDCDACGGDHLHQKGSCPYWGHEDDV